MTDDEKRAYLSNLVFYAIDKASPYDLAMHEETNTLAKIMTYTLLALQITANGIQDLWLRINAFIGNAGGKPIPPSVASKCQSVKDVWAAVCASAGIPPGTK